MGKEGFDNTRIFFAILRELCQIVGFLVIVTFDDTSASVTDTANAFPLARNNDV